MTPLVSIVIVTRNRKSDVLRALTSCFDQDYASMEVLVFDDASTDGTTDAVAGQFPTVRLRREAQNVGQCRLRNAGFRQAQGSYVFSLDDDAFFTGDDTVTQAVQVFEQRSDVAVVALPFVEPGRVDQGVMDRNLSGGTLPELSTFVACAAAFRRDAVLEVDGYRDYFFGQGEERDLCIRLMHRAWKIVYGCTEPMVHVPSTIRDRRRIDRNGVRNTLLFEVLNVPHPYVMPRVLGDCVKLMAWSPGWYRACDIVAGMGSCLKYLRRRRPVSHETYNRFRRLPHHGPMPWIAELEQRAAIRISGG